MKTLKYTIVLALASFALSQTPDPSIQGGRFIAANYGQWQAQVVSFNPGVACVQPVTFTLYNNSTFSPWNTNAPILVAFETVTPTSFDFISQPGQVCIHALYLQAHFGGDTVKSGSAGLQEAINAAGIRGGGMVTIDANWQGTTAMKTAAVIPANVNIEDLRSGGTPALPFTPQVPAFWVRQGTLLTADGRIGTDQNAIQEPTLGCRTDAKTAATASVTCNGVPNSVIVIYFDCGFGTENLCYAEWSGKVGDVPVRYNSGTPVITGCFHPTALFDSVNAKWKAYCVNANNVQIDEYESTDGVTSWSLTHSAVLSSTASTWDANQLANPNIFFLNSSGSWEMTYVARGGASFNNNNWQVGCAMSANFGITWTKCAGNPVISLTGISSGSLDVFKVGATYFGYGWDSQAKIGSGNANVTPTDIFRYQSSDGQAWSRSFGTPALSRWTSDEGATEANGQLANPSIVQFSGGMCTQVPVCSLMVYTADINGLVNGFFHLNFAIAYAPMTAVVSTTENSSKGYAESGLAPGGNGNLGVVNFSNLVPLTVMLTSGQKRAVVLPDILDTENGSNGVVNNIDTDGELTFSAATTSSTYSFTGLYSTHPVCTITPIFDPGSGVRIWISTLSTGSIQLTASSAITGTVEFHCIATQFNSMP